MVMAPMFQAQHVLICLVLVSCPGDATDSHRKSMMSVEVDERANVHSTAIMRSDLWEGEKPDNLIKNGNFDQGNEHWKEYKPSKPNIFHLHKVFGETLMHLHGWCFQTAGGIQQEVPTIPDRSYTLKWLAYTGHWDGKKEVEMTVNFGDFTKTYKIDKTKGPAITAPSPHRGVAPEKFQESVTATKTKTVLSFYAPMGHCMDIDSVELTLDPTTTTTPKSGTRTPGSTLFTFLGVSMWFWR
eukprot:symbB.v1.2.011455.t1/scaffold713.1/size170176/4